MLDHLSDEVFRDAGTVHLLRVAAGDVRVLILEPRR